MHLNLFWSKQFLRYTSSPFHNDQTDNATLIPPLPNSSLAHSSFKPFSTFPICGFLYDIFLNIYIFVIVMYCLYDLLVNT